MKGQALKNWFCGWCVGGLLVGQSVVGVAQAQQEAVQGVYTCIDARGRTLTSDRPISECRDREQRLLNPSGTVKGTVGPTLTYQERTELEAKRKAEQEERARTLEERRRDRALLIRYPRREVHDKERAEALSQIAVVRQAAQHRAEELQRQRTVLNQEMEFYKTDPGKAPPSLRRQVAEVANSLAVQDRFIAEQDAERGRVNARFDEDLARLEPLWAMQSGSSNRR